MAKANVQLTQADVDLAAYEFVTQAKDFFKRQRKDAGYEDLWLAIEDSYHNKMSDYYDGIAGVKDAMNFKIIERITPKIKKLIFPPDETWFAVEPEDEDSAIQIAQAKEAYSLLDEQTKELRIKSLYTRAIRTMTKMGTVWSKTIWKRTVRETYKRDKKNKRVKDFVVEYDNPTIYTPSIWNIYVDIADEDLDGIIIESIVKDYSKLYSNRVRTEGGVTKGIYRNVERLQQYLNPEVKDSEKQASNSLRGLFNHTYGRHEQKIETLECWGPIPLWFLTKSADDKRSGAMIEGLITIAVSSGVSGEAVGETLRVTDNPYDHQKKPYNRARFLPVDGRVYGMSAIEHNLTIERGANTIINQVLDMQTFNLRPKWLIDNNAEIDINSLKDLNEQIIETEEMQGLQALRPNDFTASSLAIVSFFKTAGEETSGAIDILGGSAGGNSIERTSIGVATTTTNALDRFELAAENFVLELISPDLELVWQLNMQFLPKGRAVPMIGSGLTRVKPRNIAIPHLNFVSISHQVQKELRINQANILIQNLAPLVPLGLDPIPIALRMMKLMGWEDIVAQVDKRPDSDERLEETPEGEVVLLRLGKQVRINFDDDHQAYITAYNTLLAEPSLPSNVITNTKKVLGERIVAMSMAKNPDAFAEVLKSQNNNEQ